MKIINIEEGSNEERKWGFGVGQGWRMRYWGKEDETLQLEFIFSPSIL